MQKINKFFSKSSLGVNNECDQNVVNHFLYDCDKAESEPEYMSPSKIRRSKLHKLNFLSSFKKNILVLYSSSESVSTSNNLHSSTDEEIVSTFDNDCSIFDETSSFVKSLERSSSWQFISSLKNSKNTQNKSKRRLNKKYDILTKLSDSDEAAKYCERLFLRKHISSTVENDPKNNEKKLRCVLASCIEILVIFEAQFEQCKSMTKNSCYVILKLRFLSGNLKIFNSLASQIKFYFERSPYSSKDMLYERFRS